MDRNSLKDTIREINEWILLVIPSILFVMLVFTLYLIATRGIK